LGECYENGELVKADTEKAREFYNQAAEQGHKLAKEALERLNKTEISVSQK
jgi:TPR repeat protein